MKNGLKIVLAAATGFIIGYGLCRKQLEQDYLDALNREIDKLETEQNDTRVEAAASAVTEYEAQHASVTEEEPVSELERSAATALEVYRGEAEVPVILPHQNDDPGKPMIRLIDENRYIEEEDESTYEVAYYLNGYVVDMSDDSLFTKNFEPEATVSDLFGAMFEQWCDVAKNHPTHPNVLYIHNELFKVLFEVHLINANYNVEDAVAK